MDRNHFEDISDELWERVRRTLPPGRRKKKLGRPRVDDRRVMAGIVYRLRTGCQWKALPADYGSGSTCHLRFTQWVRAGVFDLIFRELLRHYDDLRGIDWKWTSLDSASVKAPKGGPTRVRTRRIARKAAPSATF